MIYRIISFLSLWTMPAFLCAQTSQLSLAQVAAPTGHAAFNLNLSSDGPAGVAGVQWTIQYTPNTVASASVAEEASAFSGNKQVSCWTRSSELTCILLGLNASPIPNGSVTLITLAINTGAQTEINLTSAMAVSPDGSAVPIELPFNSIGLGRIARRPDAPPRQVRVVSAAAPSPGIAAFSLRMSPQRGAALPTTALAAPAPFAEPPMVGESKKVAESPADEESTDETQETSESTVCNADSEADPADRKTKECIARRRRSCRHTEEPSHTEKPSKVAPSSATAASSPAREK